MSTTAPQGNYRRLWSKFKDINGDLADPSSAIVQIQAPDGTWIQESMIRSSLGLWYYDLLLAQSGNEPYMYRCVGDGAVVAESGPRFIRVPTPSFSRSAPS